MIIQPPKISRPYLSLPDGWDTAWRAAKAASNTTPAHIALIGDSIGSGKGSTDWFTNGFFGKLRASILASGNTLYGDFWNPYNHTVNSGTGALGVRPFGTYSAADSATFYFAGYNAALFFGASTANPEVTFTLPYACTSIDIFYGCYSNGTWTYKVNGGSAQTVTVAGGTGTFTGYKIKKVTIAGPLAINSTIAFGGQSASNVLAIQGIATYAATTGLGFVNATIPAKGAADLAADLTGGFTGGPVDRVILWQGVNIQGASPASPTGWGYPTQAPLVLIELGENDNAEATTEANYKTALRRLILACRRGYANCSIIIIGTAHPDSTSSDVTISNDSTWHNYLIWQKQMADAYNCAHFNVNAKWGETPFANGFLPNNDVHPTDAGHLDIANTLATII